ncbi:TOMM precursor leader peptide-binding protein (plasmid) [Streptomyces sp. BI20]|uniref:TOMM precursor leader peptide-binding protein n=1 Tax=Streptomyces sp. BI20 TaxID=3403460 RepID=UPI003C7873ED
MASENGRGTAATVDATKVGEKRDGVGGARFPGEGTRIFLRQDAVFIEADGGVFLRGGNGEFFVDNPSAYPWLSRLAPALAAGTTLRELCSGLDPARAATLTHLVGLLAGHGFVRSLAEEPDELLGPAERARFAPQLAYLAHHTDTPAAALRRVRRARVLVAGAGHGAPAAARALLRNGFGRVGLLRPDGAGDPEAAASVRAEARELTAAGVDAGVEELPIPGDLRAEDTRISDWAPTAVLVTAEGLTGTAVTALADLARRRAAPFLAVRLVGETLLKGPLVDPGAAGACRHCLRRQLGDTADDALLAAFLRDEENERPRRVFSGRTPGDSAFTPLLDAMTGNELAAEMFLHVSGAFSSELLGAVVLQDVESLESRREWIPRRLDCPACGPGPDGGSEGTRQVMTAVKSFRAGDADLSEDPVERASRHAAALAPTTGLLRAFDDDDLPQFPVRAARLRVADPAGTEVLGHAVGTSLDARALAVERALRHAAAHAPAPPPTRYTTAAALRVEQGDPVAFAGLEDHPRPWTPTLRLRDDATVWVPVERALPTGPGAPAGVGVGCSARATLTSALLSALLTERLDALLAGLARPAPLRSTQGLQALDTPLLRALNRGGTLRLGRLPDPRDGTAPSLPVHVVLARHEPDRPGTGPSHQVAAIGATESAAVGAALVELVAALGPYPAGAPGGPTTVRCPEDWPTPDLPPHPAPPVPVPVPVDDRAHGHGPGPDEDTGTRAESDPERIVAALAARNRDALFLPLAPAALPTGPDGTPTALIGRVLLT